MNAVYPNGDNMRDIPDYTLMMPDWVWRYYEQSGDKALLASSYETLKSVANYVKTNIATSGSAAGLVYNLFGGTSSYQYGIIDWPAPMRYGYTFDDNAARTIHNAHAVGTLRATAKAARELGKPEDGAVFDAWADDLTTAINAKLTRPDGLYTDGLSSAAGNPQIANAAQHAQTYPVYYGVAPAANRARAGGQHQGPGHEAGPDDLARAAEGADRPRRLRPGREADDRRERRRPRAHAGPAGHVHVGAVEPGLQQRLALRADQQRVDVARLGRVGDRGHDRVAGRDRGHEPRARRRSGSSRPRSTRPTCTASRGSAWTQRGTVGVAWKRVSGTYVLDVDVPTNVTATVAIPNPGGAVNYVGVGAGAPKKVGQQGDRTVFTVGSGSTHFSIGAEVPGGVGGTVPPTLSLQLGDAASFGAFTPGVARDYMASTTATVISTAGDATLSVVDPSTNAPGRLVNGAFALAQPLQARAKGGASPRSRAAHADQLRGARLQRHRADRLPQSIQRPLRTDLLETLTFTLSTTNRASKNSDTPPAAHRRHLRARR